jgi:hypothetical protein
MTMTHLDKLMIEAYKTAQAIRKLDKHLNDVNKAIEQEQAKAIKDTTNEKTTDSDTSVGDAYGCG